MIIFDALFNHETMGLFAIPTKKQPHPWLTGSALDRTEIKNAKIQLFTAEPTLDICNPLPRYALTTTHVTSTQRKWNSFAVSSRTMLVNGQPAQLVPSGTNGSPR